MCTPSAGLAGPASLPHPWHPLTGIIFRQALCSTNHFQGTVVPVLSQGQPGNLEIQKGYVTWETLRPTEVKYIWFIKF